MAARLYGAVIRTRNLDAMRRFLSETVGLGNPVVNSNFWLEYEMADGGMVLVVERDETATSSTGACSCNLAWCLSVEDLDAFEKRMTDQGYGPEGATDAPSGARALLFRDPEGNPFMAVGGGQ